MELKQGIYTVGAVDGEVRVFHGYHTDFGTTYNAYLVLDEQVTLIDCVKARFAGVLLQNIAAVIGERPIDNIICNHVEPDHSGALPAMVACYPQAKVYGTAACHKELAVYYPDCTYPAVTVKAGDSLCTGKRHFSFIPMPMVHWPDSMSTYLEEDSILFSNDAMGQHIGTGEVLDTQLSPEWLTERMGDYYANIVLPFALPVQNLLKAVTGLALDMVCPSHGVVLTKSILPTVEKYQAWSRNESDDKRAVIVYDTMWGTTEKMAMRLQAELTADGIAAELIRLSDKHYSYAMTQLLEAKYIFVGSPTLNNQMMPSVAAFLTYMRGLKPKNRIGKAFGAYGWSGESVALIDEQLKACGFETLPSEKVQWNE